MYRRLVLELVAAVAAAAVLLFVFTYVFKPDGLRDLDSYLPGILAFSIVFLVKRIVDYRRARDKESS